MKVLVVGCGYLGARLAGLLHEGGHEIVGITASGNSARSRGGPEQRFPVLAGDVGGGALQHFWPKNGAPQAVIHCASSNRGDAAEYRHVYLRGCKCLLESFPGAALIFTSSTSVYAQTDGSWVTEESDASPERETSRILRETEEFVLARGGCVARLAGIYGPDRSFVLKRFLEGKAVIEGGGAGRWLNQIHREDAAGALAHLATGGHRGIFNVTDGAPLTQRECFEFLAARFSKPVPPEAPADHTRKRAWTNKRIANAKLRATAWEPRFAGYFDALDHDPDLIPSIVSQIDRSGSDCIPDQAPASAANIVLVGLMGSGKTTVGRIAASKLGFDFIDTDQLIAESAGKTIPEIFSEEGEESFRRHESAVLRSLIGLRRHVIATGGGIVTRPENLPILRELGFVVWLDAGLEVLQERTGRGHDRPLLQVGDPAAKLRELHRNRAPLYEQICNLRISTDDLSLQDAAYGLAESARVYFSGKC